MTRERGELEVAYGRRFEERLRRLPESRRTACLRVIEALARQEPTPGMRVKPILPGKFYSEARISSGDRLIFRTADGILHLIDVVTHDDIVRYAAPGKS